MVRIAPGTKPWDALMEAVLDGIEGKADSALSQLLDKLSAAENLADLDDPAAARDALDVYNKAESEALSTVNGIADVILVSSSGLVDTYNIILDDGTIKEFHVTNGAPGKGIASIVLQGAVGLVKTYRITYTDGTTQDYTVSDGAAGATGAAGRGIESIALQSTSGLNKTYRVTYTDGETFDFTVTNGRGISSIALQGTSGLDKTYRITYNDGGTFDFTVTDGTPGSTGPVPTLHATSTTSRTIGTGSKQFDVPAMSVPFQVGMVVRVTSDADPSNYMAGLVTAATSTSVTINVSEIGGAGTKADWTLNLGSFRGATGAQGYANIISGPAGSVPGPYPDGTLTYEY